MHDNLKESVKSSSFLNGIRSNHLSEKDPQSNTLTMSVSNYYENTYQSTQFRFESLKSDTPDLNIVDGSRLINRRLLVLGCGTGYDVTFLVKDNSVLGMDIMHLALKMAKTRGLEVIQTDLGRGLFFLDNSFDIIICKEVLEHLFDPIALLKEIHRVMRDDGYVYVTVPNQLHWWRYRLRILLGKDLLVDVRDPRINEWNYFHIRFFSFKGFKSMVKNAGFKVAKFYYEPKDMGIRPVNFLPKRFRLKLIALSPSLFSPNIRARLIKDSL